MKQKKCFKCHTIKSVQDFYKHSEMSDGYLNKCKECAKKDSRERLIRDKDKVKAYELDRYRYNIERLKKHKYAGIVNRCEGKHKKRNYHVEGTKYLSWNEYHEWWVKNIGDFSRCYEIWKNSGFKNKYAPSIDRIDSKLGYTPENMQWLLLTDNSSKG